MTITPAPVRGITGRIPVIDTDSHVTEPLDLWTSRLASKWHDRAPRAEVDDEGRHRWRVGERWLTAVGFWTQAGWREFYPSTPPSWDDVEVGSWDPNERLKKLDEYGIAVQLLYPNVIAFDSKAFMDLGPELGLLCVQAYNDFLVDFASVDPTRLIPLMMLPFWDLEASVREMARAKAAGHRGVVFGSRYERIGLPRLVDPHWDALFGAAQDMELSVNFHVGFSSTTDEASTSHVTRGEAPLADVVALDASGFMSNITTIVDLTAYGICERFPRLDFVSVESGFGYMPYVMETLDWQWKNTGGHKRYPKRLLPSEYFRRQIYATFWFEQRTLALLPEYEDNVMFESDYPSTRRA